MTREQKTIADLRERVRGLEEEIALAVKRVFLREDAQRRAVYA